MCKRGIRHADILTYTPHCIVCILKYDIAFPCYLSQMVKGATGAVRGG